MKSRSSDSARISCERLRSVGWTVLATGEPRLASGLRPGGEVDIERLSAVRRCRVCVACRPGRAGKAAARRGARGRRLTGIGHGSPEHARPAGDLARRSAGHDPGAAGFRPGVRARAPGAGSAGVRGTHLAHALQPRPAGPHRRETRPRARARDGDATVRTLADVALGTGLRVPRSAGGGKPLPDPERRADSYRRTSPTVHPSAAAGGHRPCQHRALYEAMALCRQYVAAVRALGADGMLPIMLCVLSNTAYFTSEFDVMEMAASEAFGLARSVRQEPIIVFARTCLALVLAVRGEPAAAREHIDAARAAIPATGMYTFMATLCVAAAMIALSGEDWAAAVEEYAQRSGVPGRDRLRLGHPALARGRGGGALASGHRARPRSGSGSSSRRSGVDGPWERACGCPGGRAARPGRRQRRRCSSEAMGLHEQSPSAFERARTELCWGEWLVGRGRDREALEHLTAAREALHASSAPGRGRSAPGTCRSMRRRQYTLSPRAPGPTRPAPLTLSRTKRRRERRRFLRTAWWCAPSGRYGWSVTASRVMSAWTPPAPRCGTWSPPADRCTPSSSSTHSGRTPRRRTAPHACGPCSRALGPATGRCWSVTGR